MDIVPEVPPPIIKPPLVEVVPVIAKFPVIVPPEVGKNVPLAPEAPVNHLLAPAEYISI